MEHVFQRLLLLMMCMTISCTADFLQNPDFETPPTNLTTKANASSEPFLLTPANHSLPGWSFTGTVWYTASAKGGHALQLGRDGHINQTLRVEGEAVLDYILSFTLAAMNESCADNHTAVNVTVHDISIDILTSRVCALVRNSSMDFQERHAIVLGRLGGADSVNIRIKSMAKNSSCWPVVDDFTVNRIGMPRWYQGNRFANGDFEVGPSFLKNFSDGIILNEIFSDEVILNEEQKVFWSPLQEWSILGTVKYIDSKHYKVPQGKAAIQLLSGAPSGIQADLTLRPAVTYTLNFTLADAKDSCIGDFLVYVDIGLDVRNFTMRSIGTGSAFRESLTFRSQSLRKTSISLYSFNETRRADGVLCGPVLDSVDLFGDELSYGERVKVRKGFLGFRLFIVLLIVW